MAPTTKPSVTNVPVVMVVDHDPATRDALSRLFSTVGVKAELFASAAEFFRFGAPNGPCCLVIEFRLPFASGLEVQARLRQQDVEMPVIFVSGHGDIPMAVRAMKAGAVDFLPKPIHEQDLLDAVFKALEQDSRRREEIHAQSQLEQLYEALTSREREVMLHVTSGLMNKQVAGLMGLSEITVKVHRGNVMRKMNARSLADLVRKAQALFGNPQDLPAAMTMPGGRAARPATSRMPPGRAFLVPAA